MSDSTDNDSTGVAEQAVQTVGSAASVAGAASEAAENPTGAITSIASGVASGVAGVASGSEEARAVTGAVTAASGAVSSVQQMRQDPVGGLLGLAGVAGGVSQLAGASSQVTGAVQTGTAVVGAARTAATAVSSLASSTSSSSGGGAGGAGSGGGAAASAQSAWVASSAGPTHVAYRFACEAEGAEGWQMRKFALKERLDTPFECVVDVTNDDVTADPLALLGQSVTVSVERHSLRDVHGIVRKVERGASGGSSTNGDRQSLARLTIVPALWSLSRTRNSRVFQEMTVPAILSEVLEAGLGSFGRELQNDLQQTYKVREYCVQWEESDLDFCHRLMQEEGIWYLFDFSGEKEIMVLGDSPSSFPELETSDGNPVPFSPISQGSGPVEAAISFESSRKLVANKFLTKEYDWTRPAAVFEGTGELTGDAAAASDEPLMEEYIHGPVTHFSEYASPRFGGDDTAKQADLQKRRTATQIEVAKAKTELSNLVCGMTFELSSHPIPEFDQKWLVVAISHEGTSAGEGGGQRDGEEYINHIEVIPADTDWRPRRTMFKKRVASVMTAKVVGPASEEIHTDVHGRIKVQFHWDRLGENNERSSCFVRSMQPWAGQGWGVVFLPRIGMEVVVSFVDGDIDRPLVMGTVYHGTNTPPYTLPDDKTKSTIKTNSTPGGDGFNELRFEDAAGHEEVFIQAQKDMNETIKNNHSTSVGGNQTNSVTGNRTHSIDKNETITIKGHQSISIEGKGDPSSGAVKGGQMNIIGKYKLDANDEIMIQAPKKITLTCGGSSITMVPGSITLVSGGKAQVVLNADALMEASGHGKVFLNADAKMIASGNGEVFLNANAMMKDASGSEVHLDSAKALLSASTGAKTELTADAKMLGANAEVIGTQKATITGATEATLIAGGSVKATPSGVDASGGMVNVTGNSMVNVSGPLVKIN